MPIFKYTLLRVALLAVCVLALYPLMRGWLLLLSAVVLAALLSYLLLRTYRDASAQYLTERVARRAAGINSPGDDDADEDREVERDQGPSER